MTFRRHCYQRLAQLAGRQPQEFPPESLPPDCRPAAVLIPLWPTEEGGVNTVLTRRPDTMPTHKGQVSFPGGGLQPGDASLEMTALREAGEELGIPAEAVTIMGRLDDAWSFQGHHVVPYVGWLERRPAISPNPVEVAEVIIADVELLNRPETACRHERIRDSRLHYSHAYRWDGGYIWGLTADILLELLLWINGQLSNRGALRLAMMRRQMGQQ
jgi:8-oxo-dGTP pyrophosphatase MutT (NUDIX family)